VIFFAMMRGRRAVGVCRHFVKLSRSLMGISRHDISFQMMRL
jgi:hypothetical protein